MVDKWRLSAVIADFMIDALTVTAISVYTATVTDDRHAINATRRANGIAAHAGRIININNNNNNNNSNSNNNRKAWRAKCIRTQKNSIHFYPLKKNKEEEETKKERKKIEDEWK